VKLCDSRLTSDSPRVYRSRRRTPTSKISSSFSSCRISQTVWLGELPLHSFGHFLTSRFPGFGLTVEARKRLTIGVELAAKPELLLFLDEPTSGLDGQSAYNIVRFLKKLTAAGQKILCVSCIHVAALEIKLKLSDYPSTQCPPVPVFRAFATLATWRRMRVLRANW
jgi:hypothetical protein